MMKAKVITLGCKVNQYESEAMLSSLLQHGFAAAEDKETADVVILNSCTVTAESDRKVRQIFRRAKKDNPDAVMVLTGCMAQAFPEDARRLEEADIILGTSNRKRLVPDLLAFLSARQRIIDIAPHTNDEKFENLNVENFTGRTRAFVKIEDGCNRFCSYCIIPYARGRVRSKPLEDLKAELAGLGANGYKEAGVYVNGAHTTGLGGGVCQISSTVYNAVKNAGLTILQRNPHSMPVSYLPKGLDAAIAAGSKDLKFRNDYTTPVVLYTDTSNKHLTVNVLVWNQELVGRSFKLWAKQTGALSADTYFTTYRDGKEVSTQFVGTSRYNPYRDAVSND